MKPCHPYSFLRVHELPLVSDETCPHAVHHPACMTCFIHSIRQHVFDSLLSPGPHWLDCACSIKSWHLDSSDGTAVAGVDLTCGAAVTGVFGVSSLGTGCLVQADRSATAGSATASVTLTAGTVSAAVCALHSLSASIENMVLQNSLLHSHWQHQHSDCQ